MVAYNQLEALEDSLVVDSPAADNPSNSLGCSIPYHRSPDIHRSTKTNAISIQSQLASCLIYAQPFPTCKWGDPIFGFFDLPIHYITFIGLR